MVDKKKIIKGAAVIAVVILIIVLMKGIYDYVEFKGAEAAASGFPVECGIFATGSIIPGCVRVEGKCTCQLCEASPCDGNTEIQFQAQPTAKCQTNFFCVDKSFANYTGGPPKTGDQAIVGATSYIITQNAVYGTPSLSARGIDKFLNGFDYLIAGFRD